MPKDMKSMLLKNNLKIKIHENKSQIDKINYNSLARGLFNAINKFCNLSGYSVTKASLELQM